MSDTKAFVDSNILIYAHDAAEGFKQQKAIRLLTDYFEQKNQLFFSTQALEEFYVNVTTKIPEPLSPTQAREIVEKLISYNPAAILTVSPEQLLAASHTQEQTKAPFWDCLIAETVKANGIHTILTEDTRDFNKIGGIKAINPFKTEKG